MLALNDEPTGTEPHGKTVNTRFLPPLAWTLWALLLVGLFYGLFRVSTERTSSPEAGRGVGVLVIGVLIIGVAIAGGLLHLAIRKQSTTGILTIAVILGWPIFLFVASPVVKAIKERSFSNELARVGDFADATLASMAQAIASSDTATLARLLNGQAPPAGKDRDGNDLLAYALVAARDRRGTLAPVRVLLDAGANPRLTRMGSGQDLINFMVLGLTPEGREVVRLLLERGADPNIRDPQGEKTPLGSVSGDLEAVRLLVEHGADINALQYGGVTPLVSFISQRDWESALYLIGKGANLDVRNADGLSVDYYLNDWKESVYGDHPEGWDRVRAAIAARRK